MSRGYPDDNIQTAPLGQTIADNAELAARLGAITTLQRSGQVIYASKFIDGSDGCTLASVGAGTAKVLASGGVIGNNCIELYSGTGVGHYAEIIKIFPMVDAVKYGYEFYLSIKSTGGVAAQTVSLAIDIVYNLMLYSYLIDFVSEDDKIIIHDYDAGGIDHPVTLDIPFVIHSITTKPTYNFVKLTIDVSNANYLRLLFANLSYNLSPYKPKIVSYTLSGLSQFNLTMQYDTLPAYSYLGSLIFTMNEP
jgi:hypothetical protein